MANICLYKIKVKGSKLACYKFIDMMPLYSGEKEILDEEGTDENYRDKEVHLLSTSHCSGTKTCIHTMMGACEMLGFTIKGRSTREYIKLWKDEKLRGGMNINDAIYLSQHIFCNIKNLSPSFLIKSSIILM